jgi:hypothetical protein
MQGARWAATSVDIHNGRGEALSLDGNGFELRSGDFEGARGRESSPASLGLTDSSQVDIPALRYKPVNLVLGRRVRSRQIMCQTK